MSRDPCECGVRWSHETANHDGPHRGVLLDTFGIEAKDSDARKHLGKSIYDCTA